MSKEIIKLDHIDVTFHQKKREIAAVKDVTIHINEGDIYGIVGYSGAGNQLLYGSSISCKYRQQVLSP